jgi:hypothetical protein
MNRRRWIGLILLVATLAIAGWYAGSPITILYHKQCIEFADRQLEDISKAQIAGASIDVRKECGTNTMTALFEAEHVDERAIWK